MRVRTIALGLAAVAASSCASPRALTEQEIVISGASPAASVPVDPSGPHQLVLDIIEVTNTALEPVSLLVEDNGAPPGSERFSLYPPDSPGRFAFSLSDDATLARIRLLEPERQASIVGVSLRIRVVQQ